jgi:hypothetical protein
VASELYFVACIAINSATYSWNAGIFLVIHTIIAAMLLQPPIMMTMPILLPKPAQSSRLDVKASRFSYQLQY